MLVSVLATASSGKIVAFLVAAISMGIVYLYGAVGETIIEKGGNLNLGIPGIMCLGALGGVIGVNTYIVKEHPTWLRVGLETESVKKIFDIINKYHHDKNMLNAAIREVRQRYKINTNIEMFDDDELFR